MATRRVLCCVIKRRDIMHNLAGCLTAQYLNCPDQFCAGESAVLASWRRFRSLASPYLQTALQAEPVLHKRCSMQHGKAATTVGVTHDTCLEQVSTTQRSYELPVSNHFRIWLSAPWGRLCQHDEAVRIARNAHSNA